MTPAVARVFNPCGRWMNVLARCSLCLISCLVSVLSVPLCAPCESSHGRRRVASNPARSDAGRRRLAQSAQRAQRAQREDNEAEGARDWVCGDALAGGAGPVADATAVCGGARGLIQSE